MTRQQRINTCIRLTMHPKFDLLTDRQQDTLTYLAAGMTYSEIGKILKVSRGAAWMYQNAALKRMGFRYFANGRIQRFAMNLATVYEKI